MECWIINADANNHDTCILPWKGKQSSRLLLFLPPAALFFRTKPKGSIYLIFKSAVTAFCLSHVVLWSQTWGGGWRTCHFIARRSDSKSFFIVSDAHLRPDCGVTVPLKNTATSGWSPDDHLWSTATTAACDVQQYLSYLWKILIFCWNHTSNIISWLSIKAANCTRLPCKYIFRRSASF